MNLNSFGDNCVYDILFSSMLTYRLLFISDGAETQHHSVVMHIDSFQAHVQTVVEHALLPVSVEGCAICARSEVGNGVEVLWSVLLWLGEAVLGL